MKKTLKISYLLLLIAPTLLAIYSIIYTLPHIVHDPEFPIFSTVYSIFIFYPSYFFLLFGVVPHLIFSYVPYQKTKVILLMLLIIPFIFSFTFIEAISLDTKILLFLLYLTISLLYAILCNKIKRNITQDISS
ncbi:hypothetical protein [Caldalkalibacillus mannanilyticus]|uniref:hypothetical protein n=1 Tax=Caldalkalibacillus mannanilyticus TaxID=1418 RepID=UPI000469DBB6|nr:hypothetical protein [Caldalkalibacillus mannanilyticus]